MPLEIIVTASHDYQQKTDNLEVKSVLTTFYERLHIRQSRPQFPPAFMMNPIMSRMWFQLLRMIKAEEKGIQ